MSLFLPQFYGAATPKCPKIGHRDQTKILNPEGHQNLISGSKFTAISLKGWILPIGGASSEWVCACSLRSRLVSGSVLMDFIVVNLG